MNDEINNPQQPDTTPNITPPDAPNITPPDAPTINPPVPPTIDPPDAPNIEPPVINPPDAPHINPPTPPSIDPPRTNPPVVNPPDAPYINPPTPPTIDPPTPPTINPPGAPTITTPTADATAETSPMASIADQPDEDAATASPDEEEVTAPPQPELTPEDKLRLEAEEAAAKRSEIIKRKVKKSGVVRLAADADKEASEQLDESFESMYDAAGKVGSIVDQLEGKLGLMDDVIDKGLVDVEIERVLAEDDDIPTQTTKPDAARTEKAVVSSTGSKSEPRVPEWRQAYRDIQAQKDTAKKALEDQKRQAVEARRERDAAHLNQLREKRSNLDTNMQTQRDDDKERLRREREATDAKLKEERERKRAEREAYDNRHKQDKSESDAERRANRRLGKDED